MTGVSHLRVAAVIAAAVMAASLDAVAVVVGSLSHSISPSDGWVPVGVSLRQSR